MGSPHRPPHHPSRPRPVATASCRLSSTGPVVWWRNLRRPSRGKAPTDSSKINAAADADPSVVFELMAHPPLFPDASSIAHYRPRPTHATHRFDSRTDDRAAFGRFASHRRMPAVQLCRMISDVLVHLCRRHPFGSAARANRSAFVPTMLPLRRRVFHAWR